jgi:hypothetical protein
MNGPAASGGECTLKGFKSVEFNLRFKTDGGPLGPHPQSPVIVPLGMSGGRAFLVFASPAEISTFIKLEC